MDQSDQLQYIEAIKDNFPVGAGRLLMNVATTVALTHGTQTARGLFADIASIDAFWDQIDAIRNQVHGAQLAAADQSTSGSVSYPPQAEQTEPQQPIAGPAPAQVERRLTTWEIVDLTENKIVHTFTTPDTTEAEALDRGAQLMGFSTFEAATTALPVLRGRVRARRLGADFEPAIAPPTPSSLASLAAAAPAPEIAAEPAPAELPQPATAAESTNNGAVILGNVHELAAADLPKKGKGKGKGNGAPQ